MGAFYAPRAGEGNQILQNKLFKSVDTIRGYTIAQALALRGAVRESGRFSARTLYRTFTFPTRIPAVQYAGSEKQRPRNPL
jgi:hypothetical protein